ncbi:CLUMA_CG016197, isoform A [Clunio marinus]|uniref:ER membrane protein complex subunit 1 n=1 Tax=Clunio marinus TaxID=568069 RepID=A0A1J1IS91_9DIPT|nr:CLUMA_CG016197, isoform A [Clunio marinus]
MKNSFNLINKLASFLIICLVFASVNALFEDQIGKFDWRQRYIGKIKFAQFDPVTADRAFVVTEENVLATLSSRNGDILWRRILETDESRGLVRFLYVNKDSKSVMRRTGEEADVFEYVANTGQQKTATSSKITAGWITKDKCLLTGNSFVCLVKDQLLVLDLLANQNNVRTKALDSPANDIKLILGQDGFIQVGRQVISLSDLRVVFENRKLVNVFMDNSLIQLVKENNEIKIKMDEQELTTLADLPETIDNNLNILCVKCKPKKDNIGQLACRFLLSTDDGAIVLVQQSKIKWIREEALTRIDSVELLDLTLSDAQGAIEEELNNQDADIWSSLYRRLHSQYGMVKNIVLHVLGLGPPPSFSERAGLVRDDFGLHKMMVIVTESGKMFGIDSVSGKQHWVRILPNFTRFPNDQSMKVLVQRTSKYYPLSAQCAVIARDKETGNGILYEFNPISGQPINGGIKKLGYKIQQVSLLHKSGENFLRAILFIDDKNGVHVQPETSLAMVDGFFFYVANKNTGDVTGYQIQFENNEATSLPIWSLNLGGTDNEQKITAIAAKNTIERVHSQGRVLADRSVLYKYINPNLIAITTEGPDAVHKNILNVYLVDVVSGSIVFSINHRRVKGPVKIVHSENWLVYTFYNEKIRRNEITSIELYEGKTQTNSTVWSSLNSTPLPLVERQTFIISSSVAALRETITEKGITNKHVLIGMHSGAVSEMSWALLDPRRHSMISPEKQREEGIIPYIPELPLQHESIINYNQTVSKISGIYTAPSGLESTCLVLVYGLDLFVTRVSPSKTFDLLKEDFDYFLISTVLIGLTSASYIVKHLAAKKAIKQAWK